MLVFTLIILTILLVSALAVVTVSVAEKRSSFSTQKSVIAFQAADSAAERVLKVIYQDYSPPLPSVPINTFLKIQDTVNGDNLEDVANRLFEGNASCSGDEITGSNTGNPTYQFKITFYDQDRDEIACDNYFWRDEVVRIVAEGFFRNTSRVIEVGIRPREDKSCKDGTGAPITVTDGSVTYDTIQIGSQCWLLQNMNTGTGACYQNNGSNCTTDHPNHPDGKLYTWTEAMAGSTSEGAKGICPDEWHIPTEDEWDDLISYLGSTPGTKLQAYGMSGFEANLAGYKRVGLAAYQDRNTTGRFMTSSLSGGSTIYYEVMLGSNGISQGTIANPIPVITKPRMSVRCIQD